MRRICNDYQSAVVGSRCSRRYSRVPWRHPRARRRSRARQPARSGSVRAATRRLPRLLISSSLRPAMIAALTAAISSSGQTFMRDESLIRGGKRPACSRSHIVVCLNPLSASARLLRISGRTLPAAGDLSLSLPRTVFVSVIALPSRRVPVTCVAMYPRSKRDELRADTMDHGPSPNTGRQLRFFPGLPSNSRPCGT
jgi:hypothetical protein